MKIPKNFIFLLSLIFATHAPQTFAAAADEGGGTAAAVDTIKAGECSVCLEEYAENDPSVARLTCSHVFHTECLRKCTNDTCPLCRRLTNTFAPQQPAPLPRRIYYPPGMTPENMMFAAIGHRDHSTILELLQAGVSPNIRHAATGNTPLHRAAQLITLGDENNYVLAGLLTIPGIGVNTRNNDGKTPFEVVSASAAIGFDAMQRLVRAGADYSQARVLYNGHYLPRALNPGVRFLRNLALLNALREQNEVAVSNLIGDGADVNFNGTELNLQSPLDIADEQIAQAADETAATTARRIKAILETNGARRP